jgi:hypothetical protein
MYERDGETNALVPVITLAGALQEGDRVTVNAGKLYKTDPLTNALIPVVHAAGDSDSGFMVPDYANMETVNRITANNGTWTVDRNGFVLLKCGDVNVASHTVDFYIDNVMVFRVGSNTLNNVAQVFPVKAGQVVKITDNQTPDILGCYFIPPAFIKKELPVIVEKNGSYSLDEVKTADTWIDGKPVYKKTFAWSSFKTVWNYDDTDVPFPENMPNRMVRFEFFGQTDYGSYLTVHITRSDWRVVRIAYPETPAGVFRFAYFTAYYTE